MKSYLIWSNHYCIQHCKRERMFTANFEIDLHICIECVIWLGTLDTADEGYVKRFSEGIPL